MKKKILKYIIIAVLIFARIAVIEFCFLYAVLGNGIWNFLKEYWNWYVALFF